MARRRKHTSVVTQGTPHRRSDTPPTRDLNAAQKVATAIRLRRMGKTYDQIAQLVPYADRSVARRAIMRELDRVIEKEVEALRMQELDLLNSLQEVVAPLIFVPSDDPKDEESDEAEEDEDEEPAPQRKLRKPSLFALDRLLSISAARRQMMGMDVKREDETPAHTVVREVYPAQWVDALSALNAPATPLTQAPATPQPQEGGDVE